MGNCAGSKKQPSPNAQKQLTEDEIEILSNQTGLNAEAIKEWYAEFMKDSNNGKIDKKKFVKMYKKLYPDGDAKSFCNHVFRVFDEDNNGTIDFKEFIFAVCTTSNFDLKKRLEWAFKIYDINRNNSIDSDEFKKIILSIYKLLGENSYQTDQEKDNNIKEMFDKMDLDNSKGISMDEFVSSCLNDQRLLMVIAPNA